VKKHKKKRKKIIPSETEEISKLQISFHEKLFHENTWKLSKKAFEW
jgi:hypothetical protein